MKIAKDNNQANTISINFIKKIQIIMKVVTISKGTIIIIIPNKLGQSKGGNHQKTIPTFRCIMKINLVGGNRMIRLGIEIFLGIQMNIYVKVTMICYTK